MRGPLRRSRSWRFPLHGQRRPDLDGGGRSARRSPKHLWLLRCDPDGDCIGLFPTGTNTDGGLAALRSADNGRTWTAYSVHLPPTEILLLSCGDARHCMAVTADGITMTTTSDGGATWREAAALSTWPDIATSLGCATGLDCLIAAADATPGLAGYDHPAVEATYNGGGTWTTISLPTVGGSPLVIVFPLSCPSPAGCFGVAATAQEFAGSQIGRREIISSFPAPGHPVTGGLADARAEREAACRVRPSAAWIRLRPASFTIGVDEVLCAARAMHPIMKLGVGQARRFMIWVAEPQIAHLSYPDHGAVGAGGG